MKVYNILLILVVIMLVFTGCVSKETNGNIDNPAIQATEDSSDNAATEDAPQDAFIYECDEDIVYTNEQLEEIIATDLTKQELFQLYPTPYMLQYEDSRSKLIYYSDTSVAAICFDKKGGRVKLFNETRQNITLSKKEFETLKVGDSLDDLFALDPNVDLLSGYIDAGAGGSSQYFTSDKHEVTIYSEGPTIVSIFIIPMTS